MSDLLAPNDEEPTSPNTPVALVRRDSERNMRAAQDAVARLREDLRSEREARMRLEVAHRSALRLVEQRVDSLVRRVQVLEGGLR